MLNKIYIKIMLLLVGAALVTGCEKSGLQPYTGGNTVGFWVHSINHSFYGEGVETLPKDTIVLDLAITGDVVDYDRHVDGTFILDAAGTEEKDLKNTAVEGKDYKILGGVVKANEEYGVTVVREAAIAAFVPEKFYTVDLELTSGCTASSRRIPEKSVAENLLEACRKEMVATIQRITRKEKSENPPPLYDLTTLQRDANRLLGYSAQQTLDYVQSLYEYG